MGKRARRYLSGGFLPVCVVISFFFLIYPIYVIRPFRQQGARELVAALAILRVRPAVELFCSLAGLTAFVVFWRTRPQRWVAGISVLSLLLVAAFAILSRVNVYEVMFHPVDSPAFGNIASVKLDGDEKVIAIAVNGAARAYPIRIVSYHHIVNDVVGGLPIAATY